MQGAGSSAAYVTSLSLQFSSDGLQWHDYLNSPPSTLRLPTVLTTPVPRGRWPNRPLCGYHSQVPEGLSFPLETVLALYICVEYLLTSRDYVLWSSESRDV